jgi:hypothetical protein
MSAWVTGEVTTLHGDVRFAPESDQIAGIELGLRVRGPQARIYRRLIYRAFLRLPGARFRQRFYGHFFYSNRDKTRLRPYVPFADISESKTRPC